MCPTPNYFGENTGYYCVDICPDGFYGERYAADGTTLIQKCLAKCNSPRWGLIIYNRKCVDYCPAGYWG